MKLNKKNFNMDFHCSAENSTPKVLHEVSLGSLACHSFPAYETGINSTFRILRDQGSPTAEHSLKKKIKRGYFKQNQSGKGNSLVLLQSSRCASVNKGRLVNSPSTALAQPGRSSEQVPKPTASS